MAANGAAGQLGGDLVGWVLGSAGSTDQDLQVLNEILDELDRGASGEDMRVSSSGDNELGGVIFICR